MKFLIADVSLGVGAAALGVAVLVALLGTRSHPAGSTSTSSRAP
jgi:hypothetical protein